ncbi:MAG: XisI protein [Microcystis wesenbergii TW10]|jgi:phage terminase large subunit GpA-like protein|uniref:XisI protein-like n=15 Tax=Microcystis TaxID=1125 RepID=A0A0F6U6R0_MICAE|nr:MULTISPECIES: XisI protein [Microcystis]MCZ8054515.1 XisI protein [Microcystis sp. LE19-12.2C]MCZ8161937.1 XisI protein [Microcystis sp. LE19-196.1B]MCZ8276219.1 XisI protein [Microcystis sp. LE19-4.1E]REJ41757.1 MAG: XisI protein [Microcystis flos-aquae TF09]REJ50885.1 MAG: XisI protein [Microcystis wesenbergii TW10]TRT87426.1 MAG: XisI protein [Microcystis aeruginosa Ma_OC_H_19870700_S124]
MDRLEKYRNAIKKVLTEYHEWVSGSANLDQESCLVFDEIHDQYFWLFMGWEGKKKIRNIQVHIRIKNEKIYIEEDWTEEGIATELLREGISKEDIVLAFYDLETRKLTGFAVS